MREKYTDFIKKIQSMAKQLEVDNGKILLTQVIFPILVYKQIVLNSI